jgi:hypothetical protein
MRDLLDICALLFEPKTSLVVELLYPKGWKAEHMGKVLLIHLVTLYYLKTKISRSSRAS